MVENWIVKEWLENMTKSLESLGSKFTKDKKKSYQYKVEYSVDEQKLQSVLNMNNDWELLKIEYTDPCFVIIFQKESDKKTREEIREKLLDIRYYLQETYWTSMEDNFHYSREEIAKMITDLIKGIID